jgi:hypothetical protein
MMVLAFSGSAVPTILHRADQPAQVAEAASPTVTSTLAGAVAAVAPIVSSVETRSTTPAHVEASAGAGGAAAPAAGSPSTDAPAYRDLNGANHSKLLFGGRDDSSPNRPGGTRGTIIHRPDGSADGGLLAGTPVGTALDSALTAVSQAVALPVDIGLSVPGVTGPLDAPLSVIAQLPAGQSVGVQVPPALSSVLGGVLQPLSDALSGLTAGH